MPSFTITYRHEGQVHTATIEAPDAKAAKKALYAQLGVKRLVGTSTNRVPETEETR